MAEMIGNAPRSPVTDVPGWLTDAEEKTLMRYAAKVPPRHELVSRIVEIGSEFGRSAAAFCRASHPKVFIHCIDLFPDNLQQIHRDNLTNAGCDRDIRYHKGNSQEHPYFHWASSAQWAIDLLFIDGDHHYEGVSKDLAFWPLRVDVGGHLLMHDVACASNPLPHEQHYEVSRAINHWWHGGAKEHWAYVEEVDTLVVFRKTSWESPSP